jgi:putative serine protease PepD
MDGVFALWSKADPLAWGGPIIDADSTVLGILVWNNETTSYSLPIDVVNRVIDDIETTGSAQHSWLGIDGRDQFNDTGRSVGVLVSRVLPEGPTAGVLQSGDVIVALDDQPVRGMPDLVLELRRHAPGSEVSVTYERPLTDAKSTKNITLTVRPDPDELARL